jgi:hypothetical protein
MTDQPMDTWISDSAQLTVKLILTPVMQQVFKKHFELDMLRAEQIKFNDGRTQYIFDLADPHKIKLLKVLSIELLKLNAGVGETKN